MDHCAYSQADVAAWDRSSTDELVNAATHGFGLVLACAGAIVMSAGVAGQADFWLCIGCGAYLASLVAVYAMSTLSHIATTPVWRSWFRQLDQGFIYLLIAGTYTPFSLAYLRSRCWFALLGLMWAVALIGFATKVFFAHRVEAVSLTSYVLQGWMPIISVPALMQSAPIEAFSLIIGGGMCYTFGTWFLINDSRVRYFHAVWHLWVIAGSACHFFGVLLFVVPTGR